MNTIFIIAQIVIPSITTPPPPPTPAIINDDQPTHYTQRVDK